MIAGKEYIKLNETQLKKLHGELLQLLVEVDRICKKNNIPYFLSHGTLLGAIRHKGFIPWDDDVDIQMLRSDYERFFNICKNDLNKSKFLLQNQKLDKHYNWVYGKLRLKNTSYIRSGQEHLKQEDGIFLDIFPLDSISLNKYRQKIDINICKICRKILWAQVGKKSSDFVRKTLFKTLSFIPRKFTIFVFNLFSISGNKRLTPLLVCHNLSGHIFRQEWYSETIFVEFEGHKFPVPKEYDNVLTSVYGDYRKLPPEEKRLGHCYASYIRFLDGSELFLD